MSTTISLQKVPNVDKQRLNLTAASTTRKSRSSKIPPTSTSAELSREALVDLIARGIETSMEGQQLVESSSSDRVRSRRKSKKSNTSTGDHAAAKPKKTAEDVFYATMNGEAMSVVSRLETDRLSSPEQNDHDSRPDDDDEDDDDNNLDEFPDASSFACFDLYNAPADELKTNERPKRKTAGVVPNNNESEHSSSGENSTSTAEGSFSIPSDTQDAAISVSDIQKYVMDHLSDDIKKSIPADAWDQIFRDMAGQEEQQNDDDDNCSVVTTKSTKEAFKRILAKAHSKPDVILDIEDGDDDNMSVFSELTSHTAAVKKEDEQRALQKRQAAHKRRRAAARNGVKKEFSYPSTPLVVGATTTTAKQSSEIDQTKEKKSNVVAVSFDNVSVRYYQRILDINPSVTNGPPIGIGWNYRSGGSLSVDQWETHRKERAATHVPRAKAANPQEHGLLSGSSLPFLLPRSARESMLSDLGYTQKEIAQAVRIVRKLKDQRRTTVDNLNVQSMEEAVENATHMMKNLLRVGRKKGLVR
jgi:hypothetical protein